MSRRAAAGVLLFSVAFGLIACNDGPTTPTQVPTDGVPIALAAGGSACRPVITHPAGTIVGTAPASFPWSVDVRDDGLTYFTELFNNRVGITNTNTRTVTGFIQTGSLPTGIAFSPDGTRA